jgi:hypothetical protein
MTDPWAVFGAKVNDFCEASVGGWVHSPADSWSNLAFLAVGAVVVIASVRRRGTVRGTSPLFAPIAFLIGVTSFLFHASRTRFFQHFDLFAMYLFTSYLVAANVKRIGGKRIPFALVYAAAFVVLVAGELVPGIDLGGVLFDAGIAAALVMEFALYRRGSRAPSYRFLFLSLGGFLLALIPWFLDYTHALCDPDNHFFQAHALWHLITAAALLFAYLHYKRLEEKSSSAGAGLSKEDTLRQAQGRLRARRGEKDTKGK